MFTYRLNTILCHHLAPTCTEVCLSALELLAAPPTVRTGPTVTPGTEQLLLRVLRADHMPFSKSLHVGI